MVSPKTLELLRLLADGNYHSGESLGNVLGVSRAAVWKALQSCADFGVEVSRVRGLGYRIEGGLCLLDEDLIREAVSAEDSGFAVSVHPVIGSTNAYLLNRIASGDVEDVPAICLAEMQTEGRGRRGRSWQSPFARNMYLSLSWRFENGVQAMEGLSLAVGVVVAEALSELGCKAPMLKWPNDIVIDHAKLGGVLIEIAGDAGGQCFVVIGLGVNVANTPADMQGVDQAWTDIRRSVGRGGVLPPRSDIAVVLIKHLTRLLKSYEVQGFPHYHQRWEQRNALRDADVELRSPSLSIRGKMRGVSSTGALLLEEDGEIKHFSGGELSLRSAL